MNRPKEWTGKEIDRLVSLARRKATASDIAKELGRHVGSIKRMARQLSLPLVKRKPLHDACKLFVSFRV
jgi:hypothetical protein